MNDFEARLSSALSDFDTCDHPQLYQCTDLADAMTWHETIQGCTERARDQHLRWFAQNDLYFLLRYIINLIPEDSPLDNQWYVDRCREVQAEPEMLDLWSRGSGKSLVKTFGYTIQQILRDPNITKCIISYVRPMAKSFLRWIKTELQSNELLKRLFPDVLYENPMKESPKWSEDDGIIVKRTGNYKECTVEARGLIKDQPTSKHYKWLTFDDMYDLKHTSEYMTHQVLDGFDSALNLTATDPPHYDISGVFFGEQDAYQKLIERRVLPVRLRSAIAPEYAPGPFSEEKIAQFRRSMSNRNFCLQIKLDLKGASENKEMGFDLRWLEQCYYDPPADQHGMYFNLLVDPGGSGKQPRSRCAMIVLGLTADRRMWFIDGAWGKMNLIQRGDAAFQLMRQYKIQRVGWERYSLQGDIDYLTDRGQREHMPLSLGSNLIEVGGLQAKPQRIERLSSPFQQRRMVIPRTLIRPEWGAEQEGATVDLAERFKTEYLCFPWSGSWDLLDAMSRIFDITHTFPQSWKRLSRGQAFGSRNFNTGSWMAR
jgi:hypothetical protein